MTAPTGSAPPDRQYRRLLSFASAAATVAHGGSLTETLNAIAAEARQTTDLAAVQILLIDPATTRLGLHGAAPTELFGPHFSRTLEQVRRRGAQFMSVASLRSRAPIINRGRRAQMLADPIWRPLHEHLRGFDWEDFVTVPLRMRDVPIGAMNGYCRPGQLLDEADMTFLMALADQMAVAVQHARLAADSSARRTDDERHRLARGLHDSACQELFSINLHARAITKVLGAARGEATGAQLNSVLEHVGTISNLATCALDDLRGVVFELYPSGLVEEGCVAVIGRLATTVAEREGLQVAREMPAERLATSPEVDLEVYHVVRGALHNVIKHAGASRVSVRLGPDETDPGTLVVAVGDDGRGIVPRGGAGMGMGMRSMRDRVERLGGDLTVGANPDGSGTLVRATIPQAIGGRR